MSQRPPTIVKYPCGMPQPVVGMSLVNIDMLMLLRCFLESSVHGSTELSVLGPDHILGDISNPETNLAERTDVKVKTKRPLHCYRAVCECDNNTSYSDNELTELH